MFPVDTKTLHVEIYLQDTPTRCFPVYHGPVHTVMELRNLIAEQIQAYPAARAAINLIGSDALWITLDLEGQYPQMTAHPSFADN